MPIEIYKLIKLEIVIFFMRIFHWIIFRRAIDFDYYPFKFHLEVEGKQIFKRETRIIQWKYNALCRGTCIYFEDEPEEKEKELRDNFSICFLELRSLIK